MNTYYKECFLEDIYHFEALEVWKDLENKPEVQFFYDKDDVDYRKNIKVKLYKGRNADKVIGVLSEEDSKSMLPFFKGGWEIVFIGRVCFVGEKEEDQEKQRIKVVIYINDLKKVANASKGKLEIIVTMYSFSIE